MTDPNEAGILVVVSDTTNLINEYNKLVTDQTAGIRQRVRNSCTYLQDDLDLRITSCETQLVRISAILTYNAEFHILKAYHHASPSLFVFLAAAFKIIGYILTAIQIVNGILVALTGYTLAMVIDKLFPGFEEWWANLMNKISEFSSALGWGVDGVGHLLNAANAGADLWAVITDKERPTVKLEKALRTQKFLNSVTNRLGEWQANPGNMIDQMVDNSNIIGVLESGSSFSRFKDRVDLIADKSEILFSIGGRLTSELSALQDNMPAIIANNIPQGIFDSIERVDTAINDRILPFITNVNDRLDELDVIIEAYQAKAAEISDRLLHPGDLLAEIDNLPDYARKNQLVKIDGVTSTLLRESNEAAFAAVEGDLRNFGIIAAALAAPPPPLSFMTLELPGRSPGITPEPHESWILTSGDY